MPVEVIHVRELPRDTRQRDSVLYHTKEWKMAVKKIDAGLQRNQAIRIVLSPETTRLSKNADRLLPRLLKKYIQKIGRDYTAFTRGMTPEGQPIIYVVGPTSASN